METRERLDIAARAVAAIPGGYLVTSLVVGLLARGLPMAPSEAATTATLASFAIYAVIILLAFSARRTLTVWAWMTSAVMVLGAVLWLSIHLGGRL
ncbi:hypothetical protein CSW62_08345 [Caulobacter sp. FWC2]|nr:hypothetical protein CSW62_08345 [Caulobacter sp. FWC2]